MKKFKLFLLMALILLSMSACLSKDNDNVDEPPITGFTPKKIAIIGDSISDGANPDYYDLNSAATFGWVNLLTGTNGNTSGTAITTYSSIVGSLNLETIYSAFPNVKVSNFSVYGSSANHWAGGSIEYFRTLKKDGTTYSAFNVGKNEIDKVLDYLDTDSDVAVVYLGANDILPYVYGMGTEVDYVALKTNLLTIVNKLKEKSEKIIIMDYYKLFNGKSALLKAIFADMELGTLSSDRVSELSEILEKGNAVIKEVANETNSIFVENSEIFDGGEYGTSIISSLTYMAGITEAGITFTTDGSINIIDLYTKIMKNSSNIITEMVGAGKVDYTFAMNLQKVDTDTTALFAVLGKLSETGYISQDFIDYFKEVDSGDVVSGLVSINGLMMIEGFIDSVEATALTRSLMGGNTTPILLKIQEYIEDKISDYVGNLQEAYVFEKFKPTYLAPIDKFDIHPTTKGHIKIYENIIKTLKNIN